MSNLTFPPEIDKLEKQIAKLNDKRYQLYLLKEAAKKTIRVRCEGKSKYGSLLNSIEGCGQMFPLKDLTFRQRWYYVNEPYNEHHDPDGGYWICPLCNVKTYVSSGSVIDGVREHFGKTEEA